MVQEQGTKVQRAYDFWTFFGDTIGVVETDDPDRVAWELAVIHSVEIEYELTEDELLDRKPYNFFALLDGELLLEGLMTDDPEWATGALAGLEGISAEEIRYELAIE